MSLSIPKILHYVWVGGKEKQPDKLKECMESWNKWCPDFKIMLWDETNIPWEEALWLREAKQSGIAGYASIANWVRFYALYKYGGIYIDTDYKFNRCIDELLKNECFFGIEGDDQVGTAIIGSIPGHQIIKKIFDDYNCKSYFDILDKGKRGNSNFTVTGILKKNGYIIPKDKHETKHIQKDITFYSWDDVYAHDCSGYGIHLGTVLWYRNIVLFVPFKNHEKYVTSFLDSLFNSIGRLPIEVYMVDMGSFDGTREVIEKYKDDRIILRTITNKYATEIFNQCVLKQGTGFLYMWCDIKKEFDDYKLNAAWEHYTTDNTFDAWCFCEKYRVPCINDYIFKRESFIKKMVYKIPTHRYLFEMDEELVKHDMKVEKINLDLYKRKKYE